MSMCEHGYTVDCAQCLRAELAALKKEKAEQYEFRKLYNAALFNEWETSGCYSVHKSKRHYDGDLCFGGRFFIVVAELPAGQISNHYKMEDWDLFQIEEAETAWFEYDGHTGEDVISRLASLLQEKGE